MKVLQMKGMIPIFMLLLCGLSFLLPVYSNETDDTDDNDEIDAVVILLFMFFGLAIGVLTTQILSVFGEAIPYTVLVFLLGLLFSTAANSSDTFGVSVEQWVDIDAELLLFVFLPPLIFGEAMSLNWYHLTGGFVQSVILAGPGVLIGAALMGVMTRAILPYDWGWNLSMTFGAILSATDPVAVVALLKSVGASPKLTILIVGESLLNDGSAMVLFSIFYNALNGEKYTAASIVSFSFEAAIGSVVFGMFCGLITVRWLRSAHRPLKETDVTMQIAMTICCAYITFFVAQYSLGISGVLACCGAGAMVAWLGQPLILNHESMHNVWGMMEWSLNTMIFLLAGLIIGHRVLGNVAAIDWLYMIILYVVLMVIRAITLLILFPFISDIGHRCTSSEAIFMAWAGLRGALGMALALIVEYGGPDDLDTETKRLFFYVGGIASLTLIVNATTAKSLLFYLGLLTTNSAEKMLVTNQIKKKLRKKMDRVVTHMTKEFSFTHKDLEEVRLSCTLLQEVNMDALYRDTDRMSTLLADSIDQNRIKAQEQNIRAQSSVSQELKQSMESKHKSVSFQNNVDDVVVLNHSSKHRFSRAMSIGSADMIAHNANLKLERMSRLLSQGNRGGGAILEYDLLMYIRSIFLEIVRVKYWHFIEIGKLPRLSYSAQYLLYSVEVGLDDVNTKNKEELDGDIYSKDWICVEKSLQQPLPVIDCLSFLERKVPRVCANAFITNSLAFLETRREKRIVYILTSFIEAHKHAQSKIHKFLAVDDDEDAIIDDENEEETKNDNVVLGIDATQTPEEVKVIQESKRAVERATNLLHELDVETVAGIRSKQAARMVLAKEAEMVRNLVEEGLLTPKHAEEFLEEINHDTTKIEKERNQLYREQARRREKQKKKANRLEDWDTSITDNFANQNISAPLLDT